MSLKSLFQVVILLVIFIILGSVYLKYFSEKKTFQPTINSKSIEKNNNEQITVSNTVEIKDIEKIIEKKEEKLNELTNNENKKLNEIDKIEKNNSNNIKNVTKNIEYITTDKKGNYYKILANSGKTNSENKNLLDLKEVRGEISSLERSTIYIVSDFGQYNSSNLNTRFLKNVVIKFEDKKITCNIFEINMEKNQAVAYNDVIVTDPVSQMKAGMITFDLKTKEIDISVGDNNKKKVFVKTK